MWKVEAGRSGKLEDSPIAFAAALLLGVGGVLAGVAGFGEVAWEMLFWGRGAVGEADVVAVVALVSASHCVILLDSDSMGVKVCHIRASFEVL